MPLLTHPTLTKHDFIRERVELVELTHNGRRGEEESNSIGEGRREGDHTGPPSFYSCKDKTVVTLFSREP